MILVELGGDGALADSVERALEVAQDLLGVVGRGLHGAAARPVLRGRRVEQRVEDDRAEVGGHELAQNLLGGRVERKVGVGLALDLGQRLALARLVWASLAALW